MAYCWGVARGAVQGRPCFEHCDAPVELQLQELFTGFVLCLAQPDQATDVTNKRVVPSLQFGRASVLIHTSQHFSLGRCALRPCNAVDALRACRAASLMASDGDASSPSTIRDLLVAPPHACTCSPHPAAPPGGPGSSTGWTRRRRRPFWRLPRHAGSASTALHGRSAS